MAHNNNNNNYYYYYYYNYNCNWFTYYNTDYLKLVIVRVYVKWSEGTTGLSSGIRTIISLLVNCGFSVSNGLGLPQGLRNWNQHDTKIETAVIIPKQNIDLLEWALKKKTHIFLVDLLVRVNQLTNREEKHESSTKKRRCSSHHF